MKQPRTHPAARPDQPTRPPLRPSRLHYGWIVVIVGVLVVMCALGIGRFAFGMLLPSMGGGLALSYRQMGVISSTHPAYITPWGARMIKVNAWLLVRRVQMDATMFCPSGGLGRPSPGAVDIEHELLELESSPRLRQGTCAASGPADEPVIAGPKY